MGILSPISHIWIKLIVKVKAFIFSLIQIGDIGFVVRLCLSLHQLPRLLRDKRIMLSSPG